MNKEGSTDNCPGEALGAYLDGELSPEEERRVDLHLTSCLSCREELNLQKRMLSVISPAFAGSENMPDVPRDFARVITVRAESNLERIRNGRERSSAGFIFSLLLLIALGGFVFGGTEAFSEAEKLAVQAAAVLGFLAHSIFELGIGIGVILRTIGGGLIFSSFGAALIAVSAFFTAFVVLSRLVIKDFRS